MAIPVYLAGVAKPCIVDDHLQFSVGWLNNPYESLRYERLYRWDRILSSVQCTMHPWGQKDFRNGATFRVCQSA